MSQVSRQQWALVIGLVGLVGLSWAGSLDAIADKYVDDSLLDAGIIYATARGINALVSALQGTELDMWLVTFSVGELLDPVNDMIERFSGVMTWAVTALAIQKLLLIMVSDTVFSIALTALAAAAIAAFLLQYRQFSHWVLRGFLLVAFLRFSLALVVIGNLWVDHSFLPNSQDSEHQLMQDFYTDLEGVDNTIRGEKGDRSELPTQFEALQDKVEVFVQGSLRLLGAMILKAVLIPLVFLWALFTAGRSVLRLTHHSFSISASMR
jgi:hypothetical protein